MSRSSRLFLGDVAAKSLETEDEPTVRGLAAARAFADYTRFQRGADLKEDADGLYAAGKGISAQEMAAYQKVQAAFAAGKAFGSEMKRAGRRDYGENPEGHFRTREGALFQAAFAKPHHTESMFVEDIVADIPDANLGKFMNTPLADGLGEAEEAYAKALHDASINVFDKAAEGVLQPRRFFMEVPMVDNGVILVPQWDRLAPSYSQQHLDNLKDGISTGSLFVSSGAKGGRQGTIMIGNTLAGILRKRKYYTKAGEPVTKKPVPLKAHEEALKRDVLDLLAESGAGRAIENGEIKDDVLRSFVSLHKEVGTNAVARHRGIMAAAQKAQLVPGSADDNLAALAGSVLEDETGEGLQLTAQAKADLSKKARAQSADFLALREHEYRTKEEAAAACGQGAITGFTDAKVTNPFGLQRVGNRARVQKKSGMKVSAKVCKPAGAFDPDKIARQMNLRKGASDEEVKAALEARLSYMSTEGARDAGRTREDLMREYKDSFAAYKAAVKAAGGADSQWKEGVTYIKGAKLDDLRSAARAMGGSGAASAASARGRARERSVSPAAGRGALSKYAPL